MVFGTCTACAKDHGYKMPKLATPLTDLRIKAAKPKDNPYRLADGEGMYLEIMPSGSKIWRMAYRQANRTTSTRLTFGHYPALGLTEARQKRAEAKKQIADGVDPAQAKRVEKAASATAAANTFEAVARLWHENRLEQWQQVRQPTSCTDWSRTFFH